MDLEWILEERQTSIPPLYLHGRDRHPIRFSRNASACFGARAPPRFNYRQAEADLGEQQVRVIGKCSRLLAYCCTELIAFHSLDVEEQQALLMPYRVYRDYFDNGTLPRALSRLNRTRPSKPTYNLLAFPLFPEDAFGRDFQLPHIVRALDFTMLYRDLDWDEWGVPLLMCLMMSKAKSYDVSCFELLSLLDSISLQDWHVEPTGTLSWYKVVSGTLYFKLLPPEEDILNAFDLCMS